MPIIIPRELPAYSTLKKEEIFVMADKKALRQDIRPLEIAIVNLMPTKIETETQLLRLLGSTSVQVNVTLVKMSSYKSKHIAESHMEKFYKFFNEIKDNCYDGVVITGAPVEHMPFEEVDYWNELCEIMDFCDRNVTSTLFICWAAQAALYHKYKVNKVRLDEKLFGVYNCSAKKKNAVILQGLDDEFCIPMSRHTDFDYEALSKIKNIKVLASCNTFDGETAAILQDSDSNSFYFTGHAEYDRETLKGEYLRDKDKFVKPPYPINYFKDANENKINFSWKSTARIIYHNWINYVYQTTPYDINKIPKNK